MSADPTPWRSLATDPPPRDGRIIRMRHGPWAPFHAFWNGQEWQGIEYQHGLPGTHWQPATPHPASPPAAPGSP